MALQEEKALGQGLYQHPRRPRIEVLSIPVPTPPALQVKLPVQAHVDIGLDYRCRAAAGHLPQNLAAHSNAAVSIVRVIGRFEYIPRANRHYAARPQDALDAILTPARP